MIRRNIAEIVYRHGRKKVKPFDELHEQHQAEFYKVTDQIIDELTRHLENGILDLRGIKK